MAKLIRSTQLKDSVRAHVVFVHGLDGDPYETWLSAGSPREFWPDWLDDVDLPGIDVWSLGYEAVSTWWRPGNAMALPDRAENILPLLANEPGLSTGEIYFVAHSLGGLVIESVLQLAEIKHKHSSAVASFMRRCRKIAFIGTPHAGSHHATLANRLRLFTLPRPTTAGLSANDPYLRALNTWFRSYEYNNNLDVLILRETKRVPWFGIPGLGGVVVKADSADPGLPPTAEIIPLDEDHLSIVKPKDRKAEVYDHIVRFLKRPSKKAHEDTLIADAISSVGRDLGAKSDELSAQLRDESNDILAAIERIYEQSAKPAPSEIVTRALEDRVWLLRRSRHFEGYDAPAECRRLITAVASGEPAGASNAAKRNAYAWCARILASPDLSSAEAALGAAKSLGESDEVTIAEAFVTAFKTGDKALGLAKLADLKTSAARSASVLIGVHDLQPKEAIAWYERSGLNLGDFDPDGRFCVLHRRLVADDIDVGLTEAEILSDADLAQTPILTSIVATLHLGAAVHRELRSAVLHHLPIDLVTTPLDSTTAGVAHRRAAQTLFERATKAYGELGQHRFANRCADYGLWLSLRDSETRALAIKQLEESMSDPNHRFRRLPMALQFGLKPDLLLLEDELEKEATRTGGKSADVAIARFALARSKSSWAEVADYITAHRDQLIEYFPEGWIAAVEIEALAHSDQIAKAQDRLSQVKVDEGSGTSIEALQRTIDEIAGRDIVASLEATYLAHNRLPDLINLYWVLREKDAWGKLVMYAKTLFEATHAIDHGITYTESLYRTGKYEEVIGLAGAHQELAASPTVKHICAWSNYRRGDLFEARRLLDETRTEAPSSSAQALETSIAIASGDWNALNVSVEQQWRDRDQLSAAELLGAGQLAQHIGSSRDRDLIKAAADKANGDAAILVNCYAAATSAGWEDSAEVHTWFTVAAANSGEDGPLQRFDLKQLLDMQPDWNRRENDTWDQLVAGTIPMHLGAQLVNRSSFEMFTITALVNLDEPDARKRGVVFAYAGTRPVIRVDAKVPAFDISTLLTLAILGLLRPALQFFEGIRISHATMAWLLEERKRVEFHQPSRVKAAQDFKLLIDNGALTPFDATEPRNVRLEREVGEELAEFLVAAASPKNGQVNPIVVRPFPLHKVGSFMDEQADITGYETLVVSCTALVEALAKQAQLTHEEEERAKTYLSRQEGEWPLQNAIEPKSVLYLDGISVTYLQHLGLLNKLRSAGFAAYVSASMIADADALIRRGRYSEVVVNLIEEIRREVAEGIQAKRIMLGATASEEDEEEPISIRHHPALGLFDVKDADGFIIDDRFFNQHGAITVPSGSRPVYTSIDILEALRANGTIAETSFGEALTKLRNAGYMLVPVLPTELALALRNSSVENGVMQETAELRAIRESCLRLRMTDVLQLPKESQWLDGCRRTVIDELRRQWLSDAPDDVIRARCNWLLGLVDPRGWAHREPLNGPDPRSKRATLIVVLSNLPGASEDVSDRYEAWFEEVVLSDLRDNEPDTYEQVVSLTRSVVDATVEDWLLKDADDE